jgi:hypothetical protein
VKIQEILSENLSLREEIECVKTRASLMLEQKDTEISRLKDAATSSEQRQEQHAVETPKNSDVDSSYLKLTLIKYLEYMAQGNEKEALCLEKVLFTVLDA